MSPGERTAQGQQGQQRQRQRGLLLFKHMPVEVATSQVVRLWCKTTAMLDAHGADALDVLAEQQQQMHLSAWCHLQHQQHAHPHSPCPGGPAL